MVETPRRNRANGDCRTPILPNKQDTLRRGGKQSGRRGSVTRRNSWPEAALLTNRKRKELDMANKRRNTTLVLRGGLCLQFFPPRLGPLVSDAAAFHNPRQHSF